MKRFLIDEHRAPKTVELANNDNKKINKKKITEFQRTDQSNKAEIVT